MRFYELSLTKKQPDGLIEQLLATDLSAAGLSNNCFSFSMLFIWELLRVFMLVLLRLGTLIYDSMDLCTDPGPVASAV